jgi:ATP-binding protein involved in chromosome partitioning
MEVPFLGEIPIVEDIRIGGDEGTPITVRNPESEPAQNIRKIARALAAQVSINNIGGQQKAPEIILGSAQ